MRRRDDPAVRVWLAKRDEDVEVLKMLLVSAPHLTGAIHLHAQQAAEMALKALVVAAGGAPPPIHDLLLLAARAADLVPGLSVSGGDCALLTRLGALPWSPADAGEGLVPASVAAEASRRILAAVDDAFGE